MDEFTLNIKLGNDAMQTPEDIAEALRKVANALDDGFLSTSNHGILDVNGNTVGEWKLN